MTTLQDPNVVAFRIQRLRQGPRNWIYWVALFTALNGVFLALDQNFMILAGLVVPFAITGYWPHLVAAAALGAAAFFGQKVNRLLLTGVVIYVIDTFLAAYLKLWSGVIMHVVVLALIALALGRARQLVNQQSAAPGAAEPAVDPHTMATPNNALERARDE